MGGLQHQSVRFQSLNPSNPSCLVGLLIPLPFMTEGSGDGSDLSMLSQSISMPILRQKNHPAAYISKLQPDTLHCFLRTNAGRPDLHRTVTQQHDRWRDIISQGERGGEDAKGFRQLVYRAINKHVVCQHSGAVWWGVALFRYNNQTLRGVQEDKRQC